MATPPQRDLLPWFLYAGLLFAGATLVFPLHVPGGAFIHSAVGLGPHAYILALEAVAAVVVWANRRRPNADTRQLTTVASIVTVGFMVGTALIYAPAVHRGWDEVRAPRVRLTAALDGLGVAADDRLFSIDAAGFKYWTGRPGVVTPNDPLDTIAAVAEGYDIRWLVLESGSTVPALEPIIAGGTRPAWIGAPVYVDEVTDAGQPQLVLYPVCSGPRTGAAGRAREPARGCPLGARRVRRRPRRPRRPRFAHRLPRPGGHRLLHRRGPQHGHGRGLVTDAIWSYGTPPLVFPRPAFEVWLPLPSFLAALTMTFFGATFSAAQLPFVVIGATVPVLAWRLAADIAAERGFDPTRARLFAIGTGLTAAIYLPLLLHSALPDSTMPFAALALSACLLMARIARAPGGGAHHRPSAPRTRGPDRPGRPDPQRGALDRRDLGDRRLAHPGARSGRPAATDRGGRRHRGRRVRAVGHPRLDRLREPAARTGGDQRPVHHRLRHLRVERSADARLARCDDGRGHQRALLGGAPGRLRAGLARHRAAV